MKGFFAGMSDWNRLWAVFWICFAIVLCVIVVCATIGAVLVNLYGRP